MPNRRPILAVDDEPANLALMREALSSEPHRMIFARSGAEALEMARRHGPALVLLDVKLPDIDGFEVCRRLKGDPITADAPVIFVTALNEEADEMAGFEAGGVDFLTKPVSPPIVRARVHTHLSLVRAEALEKSYLSAIHMLGRAGEFNDSDTGVHIWRMAAYCRALAEASGWDPEDAKLLEQAAPMHDLGKIGIPDAILKKPGKLDAAEWVVMKTHCRLGHDILAGSAAPVFRLAAQIALSHHERWDGSGYPSGLAGEAIPQAGRIAAIADVFDALSMKRPYKEPWPMDRILQLMRDESGRHFDPALVELLLQYVDRLEAIRDHWDATERQIRGIGAGGGAADLISAA